MFQGNRQGTMPPPLQDPMAFNNQQTPISPTYQTPTSHRPGSMQSLTGSLLQPSPDMPTQNNFGTPFFDPGTSGNFNFDLEGLNFGNHYGALEFGMLGHMSSGVAETPPQDNGHMGHQSGDIAFNTGVFGNGVQYGQMYNTQDTLIPEFSNGGLFGNDGMQQQHPMPNAFAIAACTTSVHSPSTENSPQASTSFDSSPTTTYTPPANMNNSTHNMPGPSISHAKQAATKRSMDAKASQKTHGQSLLHKRKRDPSMVYETVHEPYPYTAGFHSLIAFIQRRFSPNKTLRIAKSLASIRPSFISCTKTLSHYDLIFMEKCFQRTLFEYEEFMVQCCTPTVVCRRTGEIAAVNKEFTLLTGWTRDVLLGKEANLNVNTGNNASTNASGVNSIASTGRAGLTTPRLRNLERPAGQEGCPQPVFLAEVLDDDSVIEFYEDFAKLAFGDSRGSVNTLCRLLKYQTKDMAAKDGMNTPDTHVKVEDGGGVHAGMKRKEMHSSNGSGLQTSPYGMLGGRLTNIEGEQGIGRLEKDGKVKCTYCWTVKRDVFDIPMMIILNVSILSGSDSSLEALADHCLFSSCLAFEGRPGQTDDTVLCIDALGLGYTGPRVIWAGIAGALGTRQRMAYPSALMRMT